MSDITYLFKRKEGNRRQVQGKLSPEGVDYVIGDTEVSRN